MTFCLSQLRASPTHSTGADAHEPDMTAPHPAATTGTLAIFARIATVWDQAERLLVGVLGASAMAIAAIQVFGRYISPAASINWAEEVIVYIAVWAVMIIGSQLVRRDSYKPYRRNNPCGINKLSQPEYRGSWRYPGPDDSKRRYGYCK